MQNKSLAIIMGLAGVGFVFFVALLVYTVFAGLVGQPITPDRVVGIVAFIGLFVLVAWVCFLVAYRAWTGNSDSGGSYFPWWFIGGLGIMIICSTLIVVAMSGDFRRTILGLAVGGSMIATSITLYRRRKTNG